MEELEGGKASEYKRVELLGEEGIGEYTYTLLYTQCTPEMRASIRYTFSVARDRTCKYE